jgi:hypothetical protein
MPAQPLLPILSTVTTWGAPQRAGAPAGRLLIRSGHVVYDRRRRHPTRVGQQRRFIGWALTCLRATVKEKSPSSYETCFVSEDLIVGAAGAPSQHIIPRFSYRVNISPPAPLLQACCRAWCGRADASGAEEQQIVDEARWARVINAFSAPGGRHPPSCGQIVPPLATAARVGGLLDVWTFLLYN